MRRLGRGWVNGAALLPTVPKEVAISARATMVARGLIVTKRASGIITKDRGKLRLKCRIGGYYWVSLDGRQVWRGRLFSSSDELQPTFVDAMERAGR